MLLLRHPVYAVRIMVLARRMHWPWRQLPRAACIAIRESR
jgi:hypothetical protein